MYLVDMIIKIYFSV